MKFNFKRRDAQWGVFNNRRERHGEEKIKAIDFPAYFPVTVKELDMLVPSQGVLTSEYLYGTNKRKPQLQTFVLSPMRVARRPEGIILVIYDDPSKKDKSMKFDEVGVKDPVLTLEEDGIIYLGCKFQIHPGNLFSRLSDNVEAQTRAFECRSSRPELFEQPDEEEEAPAAGEQTDLEDDDEGEETE